MYEFTEDIKIFERLYLEQRTEVTQFFEMKLRCRNGESTMSG